jgi:hypothetical protein
MAVNKYIIQLVVDTGNGTAKVKGVSKAFEDLDRQTRRTKESIDKSKKSLDDLGGAAGIAGATAAEFGRLVSDLPYGLQAVTNNISQLGSMFALLVSSSGGVGKAFKNLGKVLLGPAGILIAFQAVVAGIEFFSRSSRKATEAIKDMNVALQTQRKLIQSISLATTQELQKTIKILTTYSTEFKNLFEGLLESQGANKTAINDLVMEYGNLLSIRRQIEAKEQAIGALTDKQDKSRAKLLGEINSLRLEETQLLDKLSQYAKLEATDFLGDTAFEDVEEFSDSFIKRILDIRENIEEPIVGFFDLKNLEEDVLEDVRTLLQPIEDARREAFDKLLNEEDFIAYYEGELDQLRLFLSDEAKMRELSFDEYKQLKLEEKNLDEFVTEAKIRNGLAEIDARQQVIDATSSALGNLSGIFGEATAASKGFALAQIAFDTATGFSQGLAIAQQTAKGTGPLAAFAFPIFYASQVAAVVTAVKKAKDALSKAPAGASGGGSISTTAPAISTPTQLAPAFNVVGSGSSQLAQIMAAQGQTPVKAYVVSGEVSTAQSLERNRVKEASI